MSAKRAKILKFYIEILKKGGHLMWAVVKMVLLGVRFASEKGVYCQADDISRHMGVPPISTVSNNNIGSLSIHIQSVKFTFSIKAPS